MSDTAIAYVGREMDFCVKCSPCPGCQSCAPVAEQVAS